MPWVKGKEKTGGRKKGIPNKVTLGLSEYLEKQNFHPIEEIIKSLEQIGDPEKRAYISLQLLPYLYPRRRTIEVTTQLPDERAMKVIELLDSASEADLVKLYISKQEKLYAFSKPETKSLPLCEQTEDGKGVGHGNTEYEGLTPKSSNGSDG